MEIINLFKYKIWPAIVWCVCVVLKIFGFERREGFTGEDDRMTRDAVLELRAVTQDCNIERNNLKLQIAALEGEIRLKCLQIEDMESRLSRNEESLALSAVKIASLELLRSPCAHEHNHISNGIFLWKIEGYQRKRQDAINGVITALYSPHFYSAQNGYKLCAKIFLNGDGFGKGTHLSLFLFVMKGGLNCSILYCPYIFHLLCRAYQ